MTTALLIFPHQLFEHHPGLDPRPDHLVLVEDPLFFGDPEWPVAFHRQKLWLHRASMAKYAEKLRRAGHKVKEIRYRPDARLLHDTLGDLAAGGCVTVRVVDPVDNVLSRRLQSGCRAHGLRIARIDSPNFINTPGQNAAWRSGQSRWFMAEFYKAQRRRTGCLMEDTGGPVGGQWSFDDSNRKKVPKSLYNSVPQLAERVPDAFEEAARASVNADFPNAPGKLDRMFWPTSPDQARTMFDTFLHQRFAAFGPYEDAMLEGETLLWHAALTAGLNIGLLSPQYVIDTALAHAERYKTPLNSVEGFLRQILGWREFMRATYEDLGTKMRTTNHWQHKRAIPDSFWTGTTGIPPIDDAIHRILETGYAHHIERLMLLGGFMFLCEFDPEEIYRWFMSFFIDAYDWVMVPNVYAMSQNADGGLITTKPYFSGSAYIRKMSNYRSGDWCRTWDGLYWRWIWSHADELERNPRWAMMVSMVRKMDADKRDAHIEAAETWLHQLDREAG